MMTKQFSCVLVLEINYFTMNFVSTFHLCDTLFCTGRLCSINKLMIYDGPKLNGIKFVTANNTILWMTFAQMCIELTP